LITHFLYSFFLCFYFERSLAEEEDSLSSPGVLTIKATSTQDLDPFRPVLKTWTHCHTGTPKDKDEVNKREVSECEG
jgi:hypothetical protein